MYVSFKSGGGEQRKADATSIPDGTYTTCRNASFDTVGSTSSARGRQRLNNSSNLGSGTVLGGFDGKLTFADDGDIDNDNVKTRFAKLDDSVLYALVHAGENVTTEYDDTVPTLQPAFLGGTAPAFSTDGNITGFVHGGYAYMADGEGLCRFNPKDASDAAVTETWGLRSPGYHTFDGDRRDPLETTLASATVTVTVAGGHGLVEGAGLTEGDLPVDMVVELVGLKAIGAAKSDDINCLHSGYNISADSNILITSSGGNIDPDQEAATYTVEFINELANTNMEGILILPPSETGHDPLTGVHLERVNVQQGDENNNETVAFTMTGSGGAGWFALKFSTGTGTNETTADIEFDADVSVWQQVCSALTMMGGLRQRATTAVSVTSTTEYTFDLPDGTDITAATGGGDDGFMRQGPSLEKLEGEGDLVSGKYYYAYAFFNGRATSNFSAMVPVSVGTSDAVKLTNVLIGPAGTTERHIYRSDVDTRQIYFVGKIEDNTTTEFTDVAGRPPGADADALQGDSVTDQERLGNSGDVIGAGSRASKRGIQAQATAAKAAEKKKREKLATNLGLLSDWTDHDPPPVTIRHVGMVGETCFAMDGADIVFSESGNVEHWPLTNRFTPNKNNAADLVTWLPFDRDVIAYTSSSVHRFSALGLDYSDSRLEEIESPVGCAGEFAAAALDGLQGHLVLTPAGLYLFDGAHMNEISYGVETLWTDSGDADYITPEFMSQACMVTSRDRMFLAYRSADFVEDGPGPNNRILFGDFQDLQNPSWSILTWEVTSIWREKSTNQILAGDSNGYVWELDVGYANEGGTIDWQLVTKEYKLNSGAAFAVDEIVLDADFAGASTTITVSTRVRGSVKSATFTQATSGRQRTKLKCPTHLKGEVVKVTITSSGNSRRQLFETGFTFSPLGEP